MSKLYYAIPKKMFDTNIFLRNVSKWDGVNHEKRGENTIYLWLENESTRGIDVTDEGDKIEIRTTVLSNHHDYQLANWAAEALWEEFGCSFQDEDDNHLKPPEIIDLSKTASMMEFDYNTTKILALNVNELEIFGPHRQVYIGKDLISKIESFEDDATEQLELAIRHIQYDIPRPAGNYMQIDTPTGPKTVNTLWLDKRQIITKYDYLAINLNDDRLILITNDDLKTIMPQKWQLLDEYTIDAEPLNNDEIKVLLEKALPMDRYKELA
ncbi:hypothetical protein [Aequorivita viscosa]|uniref:Uncharacterized protein n=1 Tax=Aequorivita viscosa TaxID=797419 RepID=A0A1M6GY96_9FLAO|nr:hypothetical protein [Aequorivita viscosa]SDW79851.1 hypothetical protein SAMN05216556_11068 [Aequorivita viscosa]SHJ14880.1 hypothetical protein SAMN04487908_11052 [Aequorivita viscosa]